MQPVQISYHGLEPSPSLNDLIELRAAQLARVSERLQSLRVVIETPHRHHRQGNHFRVRLEAVVPGGDIVVNHEDEAGSGDEDAHQAVRRGFDTLRRRLTASEERSHGKERAHGDAKRTIRPVR